jgi:hypothetical protein
MTSNVKTQLIASEFISVISVVNSGLENIKLLLFILTAYAHTLAFVIIGVVDYANSEWKTSSVRRYGPDKTLDHEG